VPIQLHIQVDGLKELQRDIKQARGKMPKAIGEAHKNVGKFVISKLPPADPRAVGEGAGAKIRASATKREVLLRVGHKEREPLPQAQWGKRPKQPFEAGGRPYIVGTIEAYEDEIFEEFKRQTMRALRPAFFNSVIDFVKGE
jgi:hypothetical protein